MIEFRIQEKTRSLNESFRGDWRPRAAVAKRQRTKAMQACPRWPGGPLLYVRLTRVSPGTLDGDSVPAALKHIRDGVASRLKVDDASPLVAWEYHQANGKAEVVVQIWKSGEDAPPLPSGTPVERKRGKKTATPKRAPRPAYEAPRKPIGMGAQLQEQEPRRCQLCSRVIPEWRAGMCSSCDNHYTPPRSEPVDATREAEDTFAPSPRVPVLHIRHEDGFCTCGSGPEERCG